MRFTHSFKLFVFLFLLLVSTACTLSIAPPGTAPPPDSTPTAQTPPAGSAPTPTAETPPPFSELIVEGIEFQILESSPVQVNTIVRGQLPDGCSFVEQATQARAGDTFTLTLTLARHPNQRCAPQPTPFEETVALDVAGLPPGLYHVAAHGTRNAFSLAGQPAPASTIEGRLWHDLCAGGEAQPGSADPYAGCVIGEQGGFGANGLMEPGEPGIGGVQVSLGQGACPSVGLATVATNAEGRYQFPNLAPGTYCVLVNPLEGPNEALLLPGFWTAPAGAKGQQSVTIAAGGERHEVNLGWDYQFLPEPGDACAYRAEFLADVTLPDGSTVEPGATLVKMWRVRNGGSCVWEAPLSLMWMDGPYQPGFERPVPLPRVVQPGETVELTVEFRAPTEPGRYRIEWLFLRAGMQFGVGPSGQAPLYAEFVVKGEGAPLPTGATLAGWVWADDCRILNGEGGVGTPSGGCVEDAQGGYRANGVPDNGERGMGGLTVLLRPAACPGDAMIVARTLTDEWGNFRFDGLQAGTYCVSVDPLLAENRPLMLPGAWSFPLDPDGHFTVTLGQNEQVQLNLGWDPQFP